MNETPHPSSDEALRLCLLRYLEGTMTPVEREDVERELCASPEAARELKALKAMMDVLATDPTLFCPDLAEIAEFLDTGHDPDRRLTRHLEQCAACSEHARTLGAARPVAGLPPEIWAKVSEALSGRSKPSPVGPSRVTGLVHWLSSLIPRPALAFAAAATIALVVVALYPLRSPQPGLVLSAVSWDDEFTPKRITPAGQREKVAFLIRMDKPGVLPQQRIDDLYAALKPGEGDRSRCDFIDPAQVQEALSGNVASLNDAIAMLRAQSAVTRVTLITLSRSGDAFALRGHTLDSASGKPVAAPVESRADEASLADEVRKAAYRALALGRKGPK